MSEPELSPKVQELLNNVIENEDIVDAEIEHKYKTEKGSGFMSEVNAVVIKGENKTLPLILKTAFKNDKIREAIQMRQSFLQEIQMYTKVFAEYENLEQEHEVEERFSNIAKCYATCDDEYDETLVLENLKYQDFDLHNKAKPMNEQQVTLVFRVYGKFHALSYALKDQKPDLYNELVSNVPDVIPETLKRTNVDETIRSAFEQAKTTLQLPDEEDVLDRFNNYIDQLDISLKSVENEYAVILHGDCWTNNMMFKYEDPDNIETPIDLRIYDFQIARQGSPIYDLAYFLYTCAPKEQLDRLDELLDIYYQSLSTHLTALGSDPEVLLPYEVLQDEWKKHCYFGVCMSSFVIKLALSNTNEAPDLSQDVEQEMTVADSFNYDTENHDVYLQRLRDIVMHLYSYNVI